MQPPRRGCDHGTEAAPLLVRPLAVVAPLSAPAKPPLPPVTRRLLRALAVACWALPLTALLVIAIGLLVAKANGLTPIAVRSSSMEPSIPTYALAFMEQVPASAIRRGDVITFDPPGVHQRVTHRVVRRHEHADKLLFETRGDANPSVDDWRSARGANGERIDADDGSYEIQRQERGVSYGSSDAIRYVFHVPWLGYGAVVLERPTVRRYAIYAPLVLLALWALAIIWLRPPIRDRDREAVKPIASKAPVVATPSIARDPAAADEGDDATRRAA